MGITGDTLALQGEQLIEFRLDGKIFRHRFGVCALPTEADGLLGTDFLAATGAQLDLVNHKLIIQKLPLEPSTMTGGGGVSFTVFNAHKGQSGRSAETKPKEEKSAPNGRQLPPTPIPQTPKSGL